MRNSNGRRLRHYAFAALTLVTGLCGVYFSSDVDFMQEVDDLLDHPLFIALVPVLFLLIWLAVSYLLAHMGGWQRLAEHYEARSTFTGERFRFRSARFANNINYNSCLTFGANRRGLYIAQLVLFRIGHSPLLIPWDQITAEASEGFLFAALELSFSRVPDLSVRISEHLAEELFAKAGRVIPVRATD